MEKNFSDIENELRSLSMEMIKVLQKLKEKGKINEEEYQKNIKKKEEFLKRTCK